MKRQTVMSKNDERGVVAIFLAVIIALLLLVTTTYAARLSVSELSQSSQIDMGESAYYAAEAGVEDALRRLQQNPTAQLCNVFPEQFPAGCSGTQSGDMLQLISSNGTNFPNSNAAGGSGGLITDDLRANYGAVAWRERKVYQDATVFSGAEVKDQSLQFDFSDLCRRVGNTVYGTTSACQRSNNNNIDYNGQPVVSNFQGLQYCWTPSLASEQIELTVLSWPVDATGQITGSITTQKSMVSSGGVASGAQTYGNITVQSGAALGEAYNSCLQYNVGGNNMTRRYIFRTKVIDNTVNFYTDSNGTQDSVGVQYQAKILENPGPSPLYVPKGSYLIDVVGQEGLVERRIVAKEYQGDGAGGIFDYVIFSGSPVDELCKVGVQQLDASYDPYVCALLNSVNN